MRICNTFILEHKESKRLVEHIRNTDKERLQTEPEPDLTDPRVLKQMLFEHGMRPLKSFGQNFLIDRSILDKIIEAAELTPSDQVLEVGAGTGVLTRALAQRAQRVVAVEIERDMLTLLAETTRRYPNVELLAQNLLFLNPTDVFAEQPYKLVANLPYYITAPTFRHFLESQNPPRLLIVMVQLEVAQRIVATPGDLSLLAVSIQSYGKPSIITQVPARAFYPSPKVDSALLRIDVDPQQPILPPHERDSFFRVVQAGFSEKRKQLHNSLTHGLHYKNEQIRAWLAEAEIAANRRAETVSIEEWQRLSRIIKTAQNSENGDVL